MTNPDPDFRQLYRAACAALGGQTKAKLALMDENARLEATIATLTDRLGVMRAALEPFAKLARPINGEEGRPSPVEAIDRGGTGELRLYSPFAGSRREEPMWVEEFEAALAALQSDRTNHE